MGNFVPKNVKKFCKYYNLKKKNKDFVDTIVNQKVASVCINDSNTAIPYEKVKKELKKAFEQILPEKSSFEL